MAIRLGNYGSSRVYSPITKEMYHSKLDMQHLRQDSYLVTGWASKNWAAAPDDGHKNVHRSWLKYQIHILTRGYENL
jgi:hypothetical protein